MEGTTFRSQFNPAFAPLRGYVNIPGLGGIDINASGNLAVDNTASIPATGNWSRCSTKLRFDQTRRSRDSTPNNLLGIDTRVNLIGFGAFTQQPQEFLVVRPQRPHDRRR